MAEEKKNAIASLDERRAILSRVSDAIRSLGAVEERGLSKDQQDLLQTVRMMYAACYAAMSYLCCVDTEDLPDDVYSAFYECYQCGDLLRGMLYRGSPISGAAAELCAAGCRQVEQIMTDAADVVLQACAATCVRCAAACEAMAAGSEGDEGRRAPVRDEVRSCRLEVRSSQDGHIRGYPIVFNELSQDLGGFRERILPDAIQFDEDVRADFNHDGNCILGRVGAGTLSLRVDQRGVYMDADPPDTTWARDLMVSIDRGDIDQGSFAFRVLPGGQQVSTENGDTIRTLSKILVRKVSVVSDPAYTRTSIELRSSAKPANSSTAGQAAPSASSGGVSLDLLRRKLALAGI